MPKAPIDGFESRCEHLLSELRQELGQVHYVSVRQESLLARLAAHFQLDAGFQSEDLDPGSFKFVIPANKGVDNSQVPVISDDVNTDSAPTQTVLSEVHPGTPATDLQRGSALAGSRARATFQHARFDDAAPTSAELQPASVWRARMPTDEQQDELQQLALPTDEAEAETAVDFEEVEVDSEAPSTLSGDGRAAAAVPTESWVEAIAPPELSDFAVSLASIANQAPSSSMHSSVIYGFTINPASGWSDTDAILNGLNGSAWPPQSASRLCYEGLSMMLLMYDAFTVPYMLCWNVPEVRFWAIGGWCMRIYWTLDLALSFVTGYWEQKLRLELRLPFTARKYLTTFFPLDLSLAVWDWLSLATPGLRVMRAMRLVRLGRQTRRATMVMQKLKTIFVARETHLFMDMTIIMVSIFWLMHVWCCIWYVIGIDVENSDTGTTWLNHLRDVSEHEPGSGYEYATALHWSVTQITPGSMEVVPKSSFERLYNVCILFAGLVLGTSLVATVAAMVTQYRIYLESTTKDFRMLETYLTQSRASPGLCMAIKKQVLAKQRQKAKVSFSDVRYLGWAANSLKEALWCQVCLAHLEHHPFWIAWGRTCTPCLVSFCNAALQKRSLVPSDVLFEEGKRGNEMSIIVDGELAYSPGMESAETKAGVENFDFRLKKGMWCAEVALWIKWDHRGTMHCAQTCEMLCMNVDAWRDVSSFSEMVSVLTEYAKAFIHQLQGEACSDLSHSQNNFELMSNISLNSRLKMSEPLMEHMGNIRSSVKPMLNGVKAILDPFCDLKLKRLPPKKLAKLQDEVFAGKSDIGIVNRELTRFIFVVAIRILARSEGPGSIRRLSSLARSHLLDGKYLVSMAARTPKGTVKVSVQLPGGKRRENENCEEAMDRVIKSDLVRIAPALRWSDSANKDVAVFFKESPTFGISTRYSRTVFTGCLSRDLSPFTVQAPHVELEPEPPRKRSRFGAWRHRQSMRAEEQSQLEFIEILHSLKDVIILPSSDEEAGGYDLYVWLTQQHFDVLSQEDAKPVVHKWASAVCAREQSCEAGVLDTFL